MTDTNKQIQSEAPAAAPATQEREYEQSGCYPAQGKPFRMWALFGWLTLLIVVLAGVAVLLNLVLLDTP